MRLITIVGLFFASSIWANTAERTGAVEIDRSDRYLIPSTAVGDKFRIDVILPIGYEAAATERYPVVYVTDANYLVYSAIATYLAQATYTACDGSTVVVSDDVTIVCQQIMLPIELLSFEAEEKGDRVLCSWITESEVNNDFFTVVLMLYLTPSPNTLIDSATHEGILILTVPSPGNLIASLNIRFCLRWSW